MIYSEFNTLKSSRRTKSTCLFCLSWVSYFRFHEQRINSSGKTCKRAHVHWRRYCVL